jgi:chemotaxis protein methyltransferase CheR
MRREVIPETLMPQLSDLVTERLGLQFSRSRWSDLRRGLEEACTDLGVKDVSAFTERLISGQATKSQLDVIASRLTVGETYFYREPANLAFLSQTIIPQLVQSRRQLDKRLRIWSAACCTGEEAYTIAILLRRLIPDLAEWQVSILATDVNPVFLKKAEAGSYTEWAFRAAPDWLQRDYFKKTGPGKYQIVDNIRKLVTFSQLNLVKDAFPSLSLGTNAFDIILCRNVLMYFAEEQAKKVVQNLERALVRDGWLIVSATEASVRLFSSFTGEKGAVGCYRKTAETQRTQRDWNHLEEVWVAPVAQTPEPEPIPEDFAEMAKGKANQGDLTSALEWSVRWIAADKLDPAAYYLNAIILQEVGELDRARLQLQRAIYLEPNFILAHFSLGNLARHSGRDSEAARHFANALRLLQSQPADETLPESDGLTAGRLREMITSIMRIEVTV